ncbi:MAG TPA: ATP-binding protein [Methylomirabilota bacterium]|nr:ATP-binding protein [Methylomirabilota bacterium]
MPWLGSLRAHLVALTVVVIVPIVGFAIYLTVELGRAQQQAVERGLDDTVSALVTAVDRELVSSITTLRALATSRFLDGGDLAGFHEQARRVLASQADTGWTSVRLAAADGTPLMHTLITPGGAVPPDPDLPTLRATVATRQPAISSLALGPVTHQLGFGVRVPVVRDGAVRYVLTATLGARAMAAALASQHGAPDRIAVLYDRNDAIIYRTVNAERLIGTLVTPRLAEQSRGRQTGKLDDVNREGTPVRSVFQRSPLSGWVVAVGIPRRVLYAPERRSLTTIFAAGLAVIGLSAGLALVIERRIRRPIAALTTAVQAVGRGEPPGAAVGKLREVTEAFGALERAAALLTERHQTQVAARAEAEASSRAKDQFLAVLSHELRTPLNAVFGWARMLRAGQLDATATARALEAIERNAHAQVQLIDDLLDVSRVVSGKMRLDVQPVDLVSVVEAALDAVRPAAAAKDLRLQTVLDPKAGPVTGDPARLQQVVWNLLINAVKFTPRGGRIQVHLQRINSHVEIVVSDSGQGIAADVLPFIFDRFRQADSSSTRAHSGLGLGLALVKHLAELHGGGVEAQSAGEGRGATFVVKLPLSLADLGSGPLPRVHPVTSTLQTPAGVRLDGVRVLVVDDKPDALELAAAILSAAGALVRTAASAGEAFEALQRWRADVLVSDIEMPGEDGYALIRKVRALEPERGGKTPAVALTAYGRVQDRMLSLSAGYNMHVPKPVDPGEFTTIVASLAGRATPDDAAAGGYTPRP